MDTKTTPVKKTATKKVTAKKSNVKAVDKTHDSLKGRYPQPLPDPDTGEPRNPQGWFEEFNLDETLMTKSLSLERRDAALAWLIGVKGLVTAEQAMRHIRLSQDWCDRQVEMITEQVELAMINGKVSRYDIQTGERLKDPANCLIPVTTLEDVQEWLVANYKGIKPLPGPKAVADITKDADGIPVFAPTDKELACGHQLEEYIWQARKMCSVGLANKAAAVMCQLHYIAEKQPQKKPPIWIDDSGKLCYTNHNKGSRPYTFTIDALRKRLCNCQW